jgi:4-diphosphocytidyl-2-C-methyl-D-erythritol kinase
MQEIIENSDSSVTIKTPAKINIGLNIIRNRSDGYHDIETIFYPINLFDELTFSLSKTTKFRYENEINIVANDNLIIKTIQVIEKYVKRILAVNIQLKKNIPIGAGMGGGSSDAAATILAVNKLFQLNLSSEILNKIALEIGSDVPFFLNPLPCFAESRGEIMHPLNMKIEYPILIVNPGIYILTKWAFSQIKPFKPIHSLKNLSSIKSAEDLKSLSGLVTNDFEKNVFNKYPEVKEIKDFLYKNGAWFSLMTGSGSTVYGIFENLDKAEECSKKLDENYFKFIEY